MLYLPGIFVARNILKIPCNCHGISVRDLLRAPFHRRENSLRQVWDHTGGSGSVENIASIFKKSIEDNIHSFRKYIMNVWYVFDTRKMIFYSVRKEIGDKEVNMYVRKTLRHVDE